MFSLPLSLHAGFISHTTVCELLKWMFENWGAGIPVCLVSLFGDLNYVVEKSSSFISKNALKELTSQDSLANDKVWTLPEQHKFS